MIIEGVGSSSVELVVDNKKYILDVHPYRENVIPLSEYVSGNYTGNFQLGFFRDLPIYLSKEFSPVGEDITVDFVVPKLFQPEKLILQRE